MEKIKTFFISLISILSIELLDLIEQYTPVLILITQLVIGILTIIYLIIKIKNNGKKNIQEKK